LKPPTSYYQINSAKPSEERQGNVGEVNGSSFSFRDPELVSFPKLADWWFGVETTNGKMEKWKNGVETC